MGMQWRFNIKRREQFRRYIAMELTEKMQKKVNDYSRKEIAPIIRYVLREDYNII